MLDMYINNLPSDYQKGDLEKILINELGFKCEYVEEGSDEKTAHYYVQMPENVTGVDALCLAINAKLVEAYCVKGGDGSAAGSTMRSARQQTLQQASTSVLAQANQLPSAVLKLLQ